ncbi:MAG TPA: deoxyribonuclease IV [Gudongella oleilytica]|nr:deoxyribonuclease IV [Gudongella oleilytica]
MFKIGCHLSVAKGFEAMGIEALSIGANYFQFFTRNPRGSKAKEMDPEDVLRLSKLMEENNISGALAHAPYTLNPASKDEKVRQFAEEVMRDDLQRLELMPGTFYNLHPGSHVGQGVDEGIRLVIGLLDKVMWKDQKTIVLLEAMAGKGTELGRSFEELKRILDGVEQKDRIGICIDSCHISDAGYDIVNDLDGVLEEFDRIIGLNWLKAVHINDSINEIGSGKDRHAKIGEGTLGLDTFERLINHPSLRDLPFVLETPNDTEGYKKEIELLKSLYK